MATRNISTKIVLDGEKEYKESIKNINSDLKLYRSELELVKAQYKGQEDSVEALTAVNGEYQKILDKQKQKVSEITEELDRMKKAQAENSDQSEDYNARIKELEISLNQAKTAVVNTEHEIEQNTKAMDEGSKSVADLAEQFGIKLPDGMKKSLSGVKALSSGAVVALGAITAAAAAAFEGYKKLIDLTTEAASHADEIITLSQITGFDTDAIQEFQYASELIDVSFDTIQSSITKLKNNMQSARDGSDTMIEAFERLGVSVTNADGSLRDSKEVFYEVIDALGNVGNETERDTLAMDILGKSAQDLNPLIKQGSSALKGYADEAHEVNAVLNEESIAALGAVDDAYQRMIQTQEAVKEQMSVDMAPAVEELYTMWTEFISTTSKTLIESGTLEYLGSILKSVLSILEPIGSLINALLPALAKALEPVAKVLALIADTVDAITALFTLDFDKLATALGFGMKNGSGTMSHQQELRYGSDYYTDTSSGWVWDAEHGYFTGNGGYNASGDMNFVGGITHISENGAETAILPSGTRILNAQETRELGGDTFNITIDAKNVKEFNDIVRIVQNTRTAARRMA